MTAPIIPDTGSVPHGLRRARAYACQVAGAQGRKRRPDRRGGSVRIGVTGGAGFVGAKLVPHLVDEPVGEVVVIDDLSTGDVRHPQADGSPLSALLPDVARLRDGLAETMEWFRTLVLYPDG